MLTLDLYLDLDSIVFIPWDYSFCKILEIMCPFNNSKVKKNSINIHVDNISTVVRDNAVASTVAALCPSIMETV